MLSITTENSLFKYIIGTDEVGRGPLAGPVIASSVLIFPEKIASFQTQALQFGVTDSKKLNLKKRQEIFQIFFPKLLVEDLKLNHVYQFDFGLMSLSSISCTEIDEINILQASLKAMKKSAWDLIEHQQCQLPFHLLIDGNKKFHFHDQEKFMAAKECQRSKCHIEALVKGDAKNVLIGLASNVAKLYRDHLMMKLAEKFPYYGWEKNMGYPTKLHQEGILKYGITIHHRKTFGPVKNFIFN